MASDTGGDALKTTNKVSAIIITPSTRVKISIHRRDSFCQKIKSAMTALINAPHFGDQPVSTSSPSPAPARLPVLKATPPNMIIALSK